MLRSIRTLSQLLLVDHVRIWWALRCTWCGPGRGCIRVVENRVGPTGMVIWMLQPSSTKLLLYMNRNCTFLKMQSNIEQSFR